MAESANVTLQRLRDDGHSEAMVRRVEGLLKAFNENVPQFCAATKSQLEATYNKSHPGTKGLGDATFRAFDAFVRYQKVSDYDARRAAEETVRVQEERKAMAEDAKADALSETIDIQAMSDAVTWYATAFSECTLGDLMKAYHKFKARVKAQN